MTLKTAVIIFVATRVGLSSLVLFHCLNTTTSPQMKQSATPAPRTPTRSKSQQKTLSIIIRLASSIIAYCCCCLCLASLLELFAWSRKRLDNNFVALFLWSWWWCLKMPLSIKSKRPSSRRPWSPVYSSEITYEFEILDKVKCQFNWKYSILVETGALRGYGHSK